ncbi:MAG: VacJ family lipoprotein [Deltaproteobacteria bacterium]|nr:VacJ family lipoprotein [Deltaproteobacteria bacterium]
MVKRLQNLTAGIGSTLLIFITILIGCSSVPVRQDQEIPAKRPISEYVKENVTYPIDVYDPLEGFNRRMYKFNAKFDKKVFLPVVRAYEFVLPDVVQSGLTNFFSNLSEITNLTNSFLQFKARAFGKTAGRIVINTTVGIGGTWDPATRMGIIRQNEDFGQTLGFYKVGGGPYLVIPILGPSTLRDTGGLIVDAVVYNIVLKEMIHGLNLKSGQEGTLQTSLTLLDAIDTRRKESFRYYETGSPFEYDLVRFFYLMKRQLLIDH